MYTYTDLERMPLKDCVKAASKDAPKMSKDVKNYVRVNELSYYVLINTWLILIKDFAGHAWAFVADLIQKDGLIPTIDLFQKEAFRVVRGEEVTEVTELILAHLRFEGSFFDDLNITHDATAALLFLLRYPKRFSPNGNDRIKEETLRDFVATENRTKQLMTREYNWYIVQHVRDVVHKMYPWDDICSDIESIEASDILFSSGVGQDSGSSLGSKLLAIAKGNHADDFFVKPFGVRMIPIPADKREGIKYAQVMAVPKSYKTSRIIAPEETYRQAFAKRVEYIFREYDHMLYDCFKFVDGENEIFNPPMWLEDQGINQELAEEGSRLGHLATLDASHASDMISKALFRSLFPARFVQDITPLLDDYIKIDGKVRPMQMLSTSGHSLTFRLETIVYKAIAEAAAQYVEVIAPAESVEDQPVSWAYGDDVIINSYAAQTAAEWYEALGLKINESKSFWSKDHLYRESCGKEYYKGIDVSTVAFPRFPIVGSLTPKVSLSMKAVNDEYRGKIDSSLTMLISLEKKLFPYSKDAAYFVLEILKAADKKMTTSLPGTDSTDPWGYIDTGRPVTLHAYELVKCSISKYEWFPGLGWAFFEKDKRIILYEVELPYEQADREELERLANLDKYHSCPKVRFTDPVGVDDDLKRRVYEVYRYQSFLQNGPKYDSKLDELLKVSSKPLSYAEFYGRKELVMSFTR